MFLAQTFNISVLTFYSGLAAFLVSSSFIAWQVDRYKKKDLSERLNLKADMAIVEKNHEMYKEQFEFFHLEIAKEKELHKQQLKNIDTKIKYTNDKIEEITVINENNHKENNKKLEIINQDIKSILKNLKK